MDDSNQTAIGQCPGARLWLTQGLRSGDVIGSFTTQVFKLDGEDVILSTATDKVEQLEAEQRCHHASRLATLVEQMAAGLAHEVKNQLAGIKGVALSTVQRTAVAFQACVSFETHVGQGSSFELAFPLPATHPESHER
ncbi:MAG TPA: hypothetical protein VFO72_09685 [Pyrinomonadaceae bacterium]|nr:hypothetical protein [Pyrinomonadaceae bacterium]